MATIVVLSRHEAPIYLAALRGRRVHLLHSGEDVFGTLVGFIPFADTISVVLTGVCVLNRASRTLLPLRACVLSLGCVAVELP